MTMVMPLGDITLFVTMVRFVDDATCVTSSNPSAPIGDLIIIIINKFYFNLPAPSGHYSTLEQPLLELTKVWHLQRDATKLVN